MTDAEREHHAAQSARSLDDVLPERVSAEERVQALGGADETPAVQRGPAFRFFILLLTVTTLPLSLLLRLVTMPFRRRLRGAYERHVERERRRWLGVVEAACRRLESTPGDPDALFERGAALFALGESGQAEADFDACVRRLEQGAPAEIQLARAVQRRGLTRNALRLRGLAAGDLARARSLGWRPQYVRASIANLWWVAKGMAIWTALHEDDE